MKLRRVRKRTLARRPLKVYYPNSDRRHQSFELVLALGFARKGESCIFNHFSGSLGKRSPHPNPPPHAGEGAGKRLVFPLPSAGEG
jgi:hypothetical protein